MMSTRRAAGSRRGNGHAHYDRDRPQVRQFDHGMPPRHELRTANILHCFPLAPGKKPPAKLHP